MAKQIIKTDVEGNFVTTTVHQVAQYGKQLQLEQAWHIDDFEDLYLLDPLIIDLQQDWEAKKITILYNPLSKPLELQQLREMLRLQGPFAAWRFVHLATDLCVWLMKFHESGIPQLLVHPHRIAILDDKFVLLPTISGILPPLHIAFTKNSWWLTFIAPEVLRTRGKHLDLLYKGDIYALGKTLESIVDLSWGFEDSEEIFKLAEDLVENQNGQSFDNWPTGFEGIRDLIGKMCAHFPKDRPSLAEALAELHLLEKDLDIEAKVLMLISHKRLDESKKGLEDLEDSQQYSPFQYPPAKIYQLQAQVALAQSPPQYSSAVDLLRKAQGFEPKSIALYLQIARTYAQFDKHPQNLLLAADAYNAAARLSNWKQELLNEWFSILWQLDAKNILSQSSQIPRDKRPAEVYANRAKGFLETGYHFQAWEECADYFEKYIYNKQVYETAKVAAKFIPPQQLIVWKHQRNGSENIFALMSIVWDRNGNTSLATEALAQAYLEVEKNREKN